MSTGANKWLLPPKGLVFIMGALTPEMEYGTQKLNPLFMATINCTFLSVGISATFNHGERGVLG